MKTRKKIVIFITSLIIGLAGCSSTTKDIKVTQLTTEKVNLNGYKTYAPLLKSGILIDSQGIWRPRNMDLDAEIEYVTKKELNRRGKTQVLVNPDFYVAYVVGVDMDVIKDKVDRKGEITISRVPSSSLAVVFIDAKTEQVIWMSIAEGNLKENLNNDKIKKRINYAIHKMFRGL